ncbi:ATP-binding protein [Peristeroidobacter soli]|uniref:ATP-binding protein n=1 Tax=Peristeroidobacter soli TaxID=2497877 RepID=UPI0013007566|nr:cyanophycin synthetase [Peristeroidobacter soli]
MVASAEVQASLVATPVLEVSGIRQFPGYVYGLRAPCVVARIGFEDSALWRAVAGRALESLSHLSLDGNDAGAAPVDVLSCLTRSIQLLQDASGLPDTGAPRVFALPSKQWLLAVPSLAPAAALEALLWTARYLNELASRAEGESLSEDMQAELKRLLERMNRHAPGGANNRFFISAAYRQGIPCRPLPGGIYQYGWGRRAQWLDSSFTQSTSNISTRIARNKFVTNALLRQAGLPVPAQKAVRTLEQALQAGRDLGYPVVMKPTDRDGGVGVSAGLRSQSELRAAFDRARKHSPNLLVEKHLEGRDYRVYVFRGRAIAAMMRVPGSVTGDGVNTVAALVAQVNLDPRRGGHLSAPLVRLELDEEALGLLAAERLTPESVPAAGCFVRLRRSANVSTGGMPTPVFDQMHPDNARLCERAARALRLDLAGIDLLMPDISRSWKQVGAGICEVNAQPQISSVALRETFDLLMHELVEKRGRLPVGLVLTAGLDAAIVQEAADMLAQRNVCVGASSGAGLRIGAQRIRSSRGSVFDDAHTLLIDSSVEAVIIGTDGAELLSSGVPIDRFEVLVISGWSLTAEGDTRIAAAQLRSVLTLLAPHCEGEVLVVRDHLAASVAASVFGMKRLRFVAATDELPAALARAVFASL